MKYNVLVIEYENMKGKRGESSVPVSALHEGGPHSLQLHVGPLHLSDHLEQPVVCLHRLLG